MTVTRQLDPTQWDIAGNVASIKPSVITGGTFSKTYTFAGGAHDYTVDPNYNPSDFPDDDLADLSSGLLGDGVSVPYFYTVGRGSVSALARTTNSLRLTGSSFVGGSWPGDSGGVALLFNLPWPQLADVTLTLKSNMVDLGADCGGKMTVSLVCPNSGNSAPFPMSSAAWEFSGTDVFETITTAGLSSSPTTITDWASDGVVTRTYKLSADGPSFVISGSPAGDSSPLTVLHRRKSAHLTLKSMALVVGIGASVDGDGLYVDISGLTLSGKVSVF